MASITKYLAYLLSNTVAIVANFHSNRRVPYLRNVYDGKYHSTCCRNNMLC